MTGIPYESVLDNISTEKMCIEDELKETLKAIGCGAKIYLSPYGKVYRILFSEFGKEENRKINLPSAVKFKVNTNIMNLPDVIKEALILTINNGNYPTGQIYAKIRWFDSELVNLNMDLYIGVVFFSEVIMHGEISSIENHD